MLSQTKITFKKKQHNNSFFCCNATFKVLIDNKKTINIKKFLLDFNINGFIFRTCIPQYVSTNFHIKNSSDESDNVCHVLATIG